jgi:Methyltransferase domain
MDHTVTHPLTVAREAIYKRGAVQKEVELARFLAAAIYLEPKVTVEVGSFAGGTLWAWMQFCPRVIGIDRPPKGFPSGPQLGSLGCEILLGDSQDPGVAAQLVDMLGGDPVDLLFIDGDHTFEGVKADYDLYSPLVRPGGLVAFHDICDHPEMPWIEVRRFWATLGGEKEELVSGPEVWGGIGVLTVADPEAARFKRDAELERFRSASDKTYHVPGARWQKVR